MRAAAPPISNRELNRATLARQMRLKRGRARPIDIVRLLAGIQAQNGNASYVALWNRIEGFRVGDLESLFTSRDIVRANVQRGTIHLLTAEDYLAWQKLLLPRLMADYENLYLGYADRSRFGDLTLESLAPIPATFWRP